MYLCRDKKGHVAAVINNEFTVVRTNDQEPAYNISRSIAKGAPIQSTPDLVEEFGNAFAEIQAEKVRKAEEAAKKAAEAEEARIESIRKEVTGMTPYDFAEYYGIKVVETAKHWSDLHNGRSSMALTICSEEIHEALQIAIDANCWEGEYGELKRRDGEHHSTFDSVPSLDYYRDRVKDYFYSEYVYLSKENEEDRFLAEIRDCDSMEEVKDLVAKYDAIVDGFHCCAGENLVYEGNDFSDFFGHTDDVYTYTFGFRLPSKDYYYNHVKEEAGE